MLSLAPSTPPWLSVLLPVYGVEPYLLACARSLLAQDLEGVELVFLDDASTDGSAAILEELERAHPHRVRVVWSPENCGLAAARNRLIEAARGEYLWFVDSDDLVEAGAIASLRRIVERHRPELVMCDFRVFLDDGERPDPGDDHVVSFRGRSGALCTDRDELLRGLFQAGKLHAWTKIVRRERWPAEVRFPEGRCFEDLAVIPRIALTVRSYFHAGEVWIGYRQRAGSILSALSLRKLDDWMDALAGYAAELAALEAPPSPRAERAIALFCAQTWMRTAALAEELRAPDLDERLLRYREIWR